MGRLASTLVCVLPLSIAVGGCGDKQPPPKKPVVKQPEPPKPEPKKETEADREAKRHEIALSIIPEGTTCFPQMLKEADAPRLEMAAMGSDAVLCANDIDRSRLLGPIACWKVDLAKSGLIYETAIRLPGRGIAVKLNEGCARGFCLPKDAKGPEDDVAYIAWNDDGTKAMMLAGDQVHLFDATAHAREAGFSIRGDKGVTNTPDGLIWIGDTVFVHGSDAGPAGYEFVFKIDGTALGPILAAGKDPQMVNTHGGSVVMLDQNRLGVVERGFSTVTVYEIDTGKRSKISRYVKSGPCKRAELDAYWTDGEVSKKCKAHLDKQFAHLVGADVVAGRTNLLVLLRGPRLGELAVLDVKNLVEKKSFKLPWCEGGSDGAAANGEKSKTRGPVKKTDKDEDDSEDPDMGGQ